MHFDAMICTYSNIITHCDITMDVPTNIIHIVISQLIGIPNNVIAQCDIIMNSHCDDIPIDHHWPD